MMDESALTRFLDGFTQRLIVYKEVKSSYNRLYAADFNLFDLLNTKETGISSIMAFLLDPKGTHGQQDIFFNAFAKILGLKNITCRETSKEYIIPGGRRIDIFIKCRDENNMPFNIAIENKPWAAEQDSQMADYYNYLRSEEYGGIKFKLYYLNNTRLNPASIAGDVWKEALDSKRAAVITFHNTIIPWLKNCLAECEAERVRPLIKDMTTWMEKTFVAEEADNNE